MIATWKPTSPAAQAARERLIQARENFTFAVDTFDGFPSDQTAGFVVDANDELLDAECWAAEWGIA